MKKTIHPPLVLPSSTTKATHKQSSSYALPDKYGKLAKSYSNSTCVCLRTFNSHSWTKHIPNVHLQMPRNTPIPISKDVPQFEEAYESKKDKKQNIEKIESLEKQFKLSKGGNAIKSVNFAGLGIFLVVQVLTSFKRPKKLKNEGSHVHCSWPKKPRLQFKLFLKA